MMDYYDRDGKPITIMEWSRLFQDREYAVIARLEEDRDDGTHILISTTWLGLNHQWGDGPPLIFETMIFLHSLTPLRKVEADPRFPIPESMRDRMSRAMDDHPMHERQWRWSKEAEARYGHDLIVKAYRENLDPDLLIKRWRTEIGDDDDEDQRGYDN